MHEALEKIFLEYIVPNNKSVDGLRFRELHMYNLKVDEVFKKNEIVIKKLYESMLNPNKKYLTLEDCATMLRKAGYEFSEYKLNPVYAESMMSRIDTLSDLSSMQQMRWVEFLVFISRFAHEIFKGTKKESKGLHLKVDAVLGPLLDIVQLTKMFELKEEWDSSDDEKQGSGGEDGS